jgi:hypothetical protein
VSKRRGRQSSARRSDPTPVTIRERGRREAPVRSPTSQVRSRSTGTIRAGLVGAVILGGLGILAVVGPNVQGIPSPAPSIATASIATPMPSIPVDGDLGIASIQADPHLVFQNVIRDGNYAHVSLVSLDTPRGPRFPTGLVCERVHFAGGQGLCLAGEHGAESRYFAVPFGNDFAPRGQIQLAGAPTYTRVSRDGVYGATSVLTAQPTEGDPEAPAQTLLLDMRTGRVVADLEEFAVTRDAAIFDAPDRDIWGVTFSPDSDRFYATLRTAGNTYLVEGSVGGRRLAVIHPNAWAPAVSPDGKRVAYAKLVSSIGPTFRFQVLDLKTMIETPLAESTSIDDQMEWLDDQQLLYGLAADTWVVPADGTGTPSLFLPDGLSAAVVR